MNTALTRRKHKSFWPYAFSLPYVISYLAFGLYPTIYSLFISFFNWNGIKPMKFVGIQNYITLFTKDTLFGTALWNTILYTALSIPFQIIIGLFLANAIFKMKRSKRLLQTVFFLPYIIAPIAIGAIFSNLFDWQYGYINEVLSALGATDKIYWLQNENYARLIIVIMQVWRHFGYCMVIYLAGMTTIPMEVYEAARIDGGNEWQIFRHVTVPQLSSLTSFLVLTSIINGMQLFEMPKQLYAGSTSTVGGPGYAAFTVIWKFIYDAFGSKMRLGYGAAMCYVIFLIIVLFSTVFKKLTAQQEGK